MPFTVAKVNETPFTYKDEENDEQFTVYFAFPLIEDVLDEADQIKEALKHLKKDGAEGEAEFQKTSVYGNLIRKVRNCLCRVEGIKDTEGNDYVVDTEESKRMIFDFILRLGSSLQTQIISTYLGLNQKN